MPFNAFLICVAMTAATAIGQESGNGYCDLCDASSQDRQGVWDDVAVGYDRGFFVSQGANGGAISDSPFLLRVNACAHLRHTYFNSSGAGGDENQFEFERARLVFRGNAWSPDFQYVLQLDGDNDQGTQVDLLDYFVTYDFGHDLFGLETKQLRLRAGQWKVPFNRSRQLSGRELSFADRALASVLFDINRSVGVGLVGETTAFRFLIVRASRTGVNPKRQRNGEVKKTGRNAPIP